MPELPEVLVTIDMIRDSTPSPIGCWLQPSIFESNFYSKINGDFTILHAAKLVGISNLAKYIIFTFERYNELGELEFPLFVIHMGMTGSFMLHTPGMEYGQTHQAIMGLGFSFTPETKINPDFYIWFYDTRRFAKVWVFKSENDMLAEPRFSSLGHSFLMSDPATGHASFVVKEYISLVRRKAKPTDTIKDVLLNQHIISGAGNIYATEALWAQGIHPLQEVGMIPDPILYNLLCKVGELMHIAVQCGGSSISDFIQPNGQPGLNRHNLQVFKKTGKPCPRCGRPIGRIVVSGRGSYGCYTEGGCQYLAQYVSVL